MAKENKTTSDEKIITQPGFVVCDAGKRKTKAAAYVVGADRIDKKQFFTCYTEGDGIVFDDDNLENGTFICSIDDKNYKIGYAGLTRPEGNSSKFGEIHKVCYYASIAFTLSSLCQCPNITFENITCGFSIPSNVINDAIEVRHYKDHIFDDIGKPHTVMLKLRPGGNVRTVTFTITGGHIFPEGIGAAYMNGQTLEKAKGIFGLTDIGYYNSNAVYFQDFVPFPQHSATYEMGYQHLTAKISEGLYNKLRSRFPNDFIDRILQLPYDQRYIESTDGKPEVEQISRAVFKEETAKFIKDLHMNLREKSWPIGYMPLLFVGGTSIALQHDIKDVFGDSIILPEDAHYSHVCGTLHKMASMHGIKINAEIAKVKEAEGK